MDTQETNVEQGFFYIIPAVLFDSGDYKKAFLYGLVTSIANSDGCCQVSANYLAQKLRIKPLSQVGVYLSELKAEGWLNVEEVEDKRQIYKITIIWPRQV